ncbi:MAG: hypothetical protein JSU77_02020 [Fidelibacterota bacterium]|nr:MAG: hypothetical protein JSU77_02020 [Candidatus Neomarinimicrobiota bacterium]
MKIIALLACLILWTCVSSPTQSEPGTWQLVWESPGDGSYRSIHFVDSNHGWAVGDSGTIIHTENGGRSWTQQQSGSSSNLKVVYFINPQVGWVAGGDNTILHTKDDGQSWHSRAPAGDSSRIFTDLFFADEVTGWVVRQLGELLYTEDGGTTWGVQRSWEQGGSALISFVDDQVGYIMPRADSMLYKTSNGGQDWIPISSQHFARAKGLYFTDEQYGWIPTSTAPS